MKIIINDLVKEYPNCYYRILKRDYESLYETIQQQYGTSIAEKCYNYVNEYRAICKTCCKPNVKFVGFNNGYREYCSRTCTSKSIACKQGQRKLWDDPERVELVVGKRQQTCVERFGGISAMSDSSIRQTVVSKMTQTMRAKFPETSKELKQYTRAARNRTDKVYNEYKHIIDPEGLRSCDIVCDHIYSVYDAFVNNVPLDVLCHCTNLRMISKVSNSSKGSRSDVLLSELYESYFAASS